MIIRDDVNIDNSAIIINISKIINQIYKLLPTREEGSDWQKPLETLIIEVAGMSNLLIGQHDILFPLLCKLEGLSILTEEEDFQSYRRTIFECLSLLNVLQKRVKS